MSRLNHSIRNKRYKVKKNCSIFLTIDNRSGDTLKFIVKDCSTNGLRVHSSEKISDVDWIEIGSIISSSKISWDDKEVSLGRLVLRRAVENNDVYEFAFSTVDISIPVTGSISHKLELDLSADDFLIEKELSTDKFSLAHFIENEYTNVDLFDRTREFSYFHAEWVKSKKYAYQNVRLASKGPRVDLRRKRKNSRNDYLVMASNDYLGLGSHPEVVEVAKIALDKYGFGSTGSPVTTGMSDLHIELCERLARIHQKEAAILFNSGYAANVGIITSLCTTNDLIIADHLCHASIHDAMAMSRGTSRFFKHNNVEHLRAILNKERNNFNGCLVITEGVFSMDGDVACLDQIYSVAREYNARVMVDQAHCWGVVGPTGMGVCEKYNLLRETDIIMGTFSKIAGGIGGFATGSRELIDWLRSFSRPQIFSVSIPPSTAAAVSKAVDIFCRDKSHLEKLRNNIAHFVSGLKTIGYEMNPNHESAVIPVIIGDESKMGEMYQSLLDDGILCVPIVYPAVGRKNCRFRFTLMATHTTSDIDYAIICLEKAAIKAGFAFPQKSKSEDGKAA